jgi:hypothetical protein
MTLKFKSVVKRLEDAGMPRTQATSEASELSNLRLKLQSEISKLEAQIQGQALFIKFLAVLVVALFFLFSFRR